MQQLTRVDCCGGGMREVSGVSGQRSVLWARMGGHGGFLVDLSPGQGCVQSFGHACPVILRHDVQGQPESQTQSKAHAHTNQGFR
jgi:hypothetical protein